MKVRVSARPAAIVVLAATVLLSSCSGSGGGTSTTSDVPRSSTTSSSTTASPTSTADPTTAAVEQAVIQLYQVNNQLYADPSKSSDVLESVASGQALAQQRSNLAIARKSGYRTEGGLTARPVSVTYDTTSKTYRVKACIDPSAQTLFKNGKKVDPGTYPQIYVYGVGLVNGVYLVTEDKGNGNGPRC